MPTALEKVEAELAQMEAQLLAEKSAGENGQPIVDEPAQRETQKADWLDGLTPVNQQPPPPAQKDDAVEKLMAEVRAMAERNAKLVAELDEARKAPQKDTPFDPTEGLTEEEKESFGPYAAVTGKIAQAAVDRVEAMRRVEIEELRRRSDELQRRLDANRAVSDKERTAQFAGMTLAELEYIDNSSEFDQWLKSHVVQGIPLSELLEINIRRGNLQDAGQLYAKFASVKMNRPVRNVPPQSYPSSNSPLNRPSAPKRIDELMTELNRLETHLKSHRTDKDAERRYDEVFSQISELMKQQ